MTPENIEQYKNKLLEPENSDYLTRAIEVMPKSVISDIYAKFFRKVPAMGVRLISAKISKLNDVRSEQILAALSKIRDQEPKLLEQYAQIWIDSQSATLEKLENDQIIDETTSNAVLEIANFLVGKKSSDIWSTRLTAQTKQIAEFEQNLRTEKQCNQQLERELEQVKRKLEQAEAVKQKELAQQKTRLEQADTTQIQQVTRVEQQKQFEEAKKFKAEIALLKDKLAEKQKELVLFKTQLGAATDALEAQVNQAELTLEPLHQTNQRLAADLLEKTQALLEVDAARLQLRQRNNDLTQELEKARNNQKKLAQEYAQREREQQESIGSNKLENALIIDYRHLSFEPAQRLIRLLEIYKAFVNHDKSLLEQTNYSEFTDPKNQIRGVLLLGLEQLLLDLVNLPLTAFFNSQIFRQESALKQLLGILESPRYQGIL